MANIRSESLANIIGIRIKGFLMLRILVAGGLDETKEDQISNAQGFARMLGREIIEQGHTVLNGCLTDFDRVVAEGAKEGLDDLRRVNPSRTPSQALIGYVLEGCKPIYDFERIYRSRLKRWDIIGSKLIFPEPIEQANAVILVGGFEGTHRAANWARIAKIPLLPVTLFDGAAKEIYYEEISKFDVKYEDSIERFEYERLNQVTSDFKGLARDVIMLAEKLAMPNKVFVIMSFSRDKELEDVYQSYKDVCEKYNYECKRVDDESNIPRITPEIHKRIKGCSFVIIDISIDSPNVFYEMGYAEGFYKPLIVTAKRGTNLPFDIKDVPTIFWENQADLRKALESKIQAIPRVKTLKFDMH